ncbi:MAG: RluA family pseudouridine synthase [Thermotogaceae bacterium]|nr:RluA family pseudouridine synthase [Thermotogaceae bacterium]
MSWEVIVNDRNYYKRLDKFLRNALNDIPLSAIYKFIRKGKVYVNGKRIKDQKFALEVGDKVSVRYVDVDKFRKRKENTLEPQKLDLDIIYEDKDILVLNKPAGIAIHPGKNIHLVTLVEGLLYYGNEKSFEPHLVHRLDLNTSGVLIVAKNKNAARILTKGFKERKVKKYYKALVRGKMNVSGKIEKDLDGQKAVTYCRPEKFYKILDEGVTLVDVEIGTGRKHQIRRHFSIIGHHVAGDNKYGEKVYNKKIRNLTGLKRHFLHCYKIKINHPKSGKEMTFTAELSPDLKKVLDAIEKMAKS